MVNEDIWSFERRQEIYEIWDTYNNRIIMSRPLDRGESMGYETKDSGERQSFPTGMVRDVQKGKARFDLVWKPLYWRWAELMGRGAEKYGENNWMKAATEQELDRFKSSAERHLQQLLRGDTDEDHAAAVLFNVGGIEYVRQQMKFKILQEESNVPF